jgi:hypothetical protein
MGVTYMYHKVADPAYGCDISVSHSDTDTAGRCDINVTPGHGPCLLLLNSTALCLDPFGTN